MIYIAPLAAEASLADGEADIARQLLIEALDATAPGEVDFIAHFVRAALRGHAPDLAQRALALRTPSNPMNDAETQLAEAMLAEVEGDLQTARHGFERAEAMLGEIHWVPLRAYALTGLGRCLIALEEIRAGKLKLEAARDLWQFVDVKPRIVEIDELLATTIPH